MCDFDISILQVQLQHQQLLLESRVTRPAALQRVLGEGFLDSTCSWHRDSVNVSRPWLRVSWFPKNCTSDRFLSHGLKKWNSSIVKNSIYTKPLWFKPTRIQLLAVATCITAANNFLVMRHQQYSFQNMLKQYLRMMLNMVLFATILFFEEWLLEVGML